MFESAITGIIAFSVAAGVVAACILSFMVLYLYKKAVVKGMGLNMPSAKDALPKTEYLIQLNRPLLFVQADEINKSHQGSVLHKHLRLYLKRRLIIYIVSIVGFALVWAYLYLHYGNFNININIVLYCIILFFWPFVFSQNIIWANNRRQQTITYAAYFALFVFISLYIYTYQDEDFPLSSFIIPWLYYNVIPSALILLLRVGIIRSVSTILTGFCFLVLLTANLIVVFFAARSNALEGVSNFIYNTGLHNVSSAFFIMLFVLSCIIGAVLTWRINKLYLHKQTNEQQLSIDAILIIFSSFYSVSVLSQSPSLILIICCLLPFAVYKVSCLLLFKILKVKYQNTMPVKLLLLRVFALDKAGRISFEKIQKHWQYAGPVLMISGPDLATATIDTHEMIDFVTNNLNKHFCDNQAAIEKNLSKADFKPDNDGSFRINEFFCRNNTWKDVLVRLINMSDVVLVDLRNFSDKYKGCQYEIQQLVNYMPLSKVLVLINRETDISFLKATFTLAFRNIHPQSPNISIENNVQLYYFKPEMPSNFSNLLKQLSHLCDKDYSYAIHPGLNSQTIDH